MEDLACIIDGRSLDLYPFGSGQTQGGSELYARQLAHGLAERGHTVHVLTHDLRHEEQRGPREWWWGEAAHPAFADVVMAINNVERSQDLSAPFFVFLPNGVDPRRSQKEAQIDAYACFSQAHKDLLVERRGADPERCFITGLGVDLEDYQTRSLFPAVPGRMLCANDPSRGLLPLLDIFDLVKAEVPEATLHIAYDFDQQFAVHQWRQDPMAEIFWKCKQRIEADDAITNMGPLNHVQFLREQMECQVHCWPSDPTDVGAQTHGLTQLELCAASTALVLSDVESFPELFGGCGVILPPIGTLRAKMDDGDWARIKPEDYAAKVIALMQDPVLCADAAERGLAVAEQHTWEKMVDHFEDMLQALIAARQTVPA